MSELIIIGHGKMAYAIAKQLSFTHKITILGRDQQRLDKFIKELNNSSAKSALIKDFDITNHHVILAVKPYALEDVANNIKGVPTVLYSILAGTSIEKLHTLKAKNYIRVMPNLAAEFNHSMTTLTGDKTYKSEALELFSSIGAVLWLETEKSLDIATAIAGSGPAYLALIAESLSDAGVKLGLKRDEANSITLGLFEGFAPLLSATHPALIKDGVMSPGGTTAQGIASLEKNSVRSSMIEAVEAAFNRTLK